MKISVTAFTLFTRIEKHSSRSNNIAVEMNRYLKAFIDTFNKIKFNEKHDNIGSGQIHLPPMEMHTSATWMSFDEPQDWTEEQISNALTGSTYALSNFIPLFVRCDRSDITVVPQVKSAHNEKPTMFIYDSYPGGIGISERVYDIIFSLLERTLDHVEQCPCQQGCPSCIGAQDTLSESKRSAKKLLRMLIAQNS